VADNNSSLPDEGDQTPDEEFLDGDSGDLSDELLGERQPDFESLTVGADELDEAELALTPEGEDLATDLPDVSAAVSPDETEAEELDVAPDEFEVDAPAIDDEAQLDEATAVAAKAASTRPLRRKQRAGEATVATAESAEASDEGSESAGAPRPVRRQLTQAPVKKDRPTPTRVEATKVESKRTTPFMFVRQSVAELKKVVWPSGEQTGQYFVVVLVFVLFLMLVVVGLDTLFGWGLTKWLGGS